jgi:glyoxylase-like metal-dependent hydrolase (beta-lactamase superfamily II)
MQTRVEVVTGGLWQLSSVVVSRGGVCLAVDAGYLPEELSQVARRVASRGRLAAMAFTHAHWDHVLGTMSFPQAPALCSCRLADWVAADAAPARACLEEARQFDSRWYVPRPAPYRWPAQLRGLEDGDRIDLEGLVLRAVALPGHSADGLGLLVEQAGTLLAGDHLSPCEIPFVDDARAYRDTLVRLLELLGEVERVVPGHGPVLGSDQARRIAREDLDYLDRLLELGASGDRKGALRLALPRAAEVVGMREHHLENLARVGLGA